MVIDGVDTYHHLGGTALWAVYPQVGFLLDILAADNMFLD